MPKPKAETGSRLRRGEAEDVGRGRKGRSKKQTNRILRSQQVLGDPLELRQFNNPEQLDRR